MSRILLTLVCLCVATLIYLALDAPERRRASVGGLQAMPRREDLPDHPKQKPLLIPDGNSWFDSLAQLLKHPSMRWDDFLRQLGIPPGDEGYLFPPGSDEGRIRSFNAAMSRKLPGGVGSRHYQFGIPDNNHLLEYTLSLMTLDDTIIAASLNSARKKGIIVFIDNGCEKYHPGSRPQYGAMSRICWLYQNCAVAMK